MSNQTLFTVGVTNADQTVQSVVVDGCKVTLCFSKKSNSTALREIKAILTAAVSADTSAKNLQE